MPRHKYEQTDICATQLPDQKTQIQYINMRQSQCQYTIGVEVILYNIYIDTTFKLIWSSNTREVSFRSYYHTVHFFSITKSLYYKFWLAGVPETVQGIGTAGSSAKGGIKSAKRQLSAICTSYYSIHSSFFLDVYISRKSRSFRKHWSDELASHEKNIDTYT